MLGEDSQPSFFIYKARVGVDIRETLNYSQMLKNRLDEEKIRIAYYLQNTPTYIIDNLFSIFPNRKKLDDEQKENKKYTLKHGLI